MKVVEKTKYILKNCAGRTVLHVGCTNYPNTIYRINTDRLLHKRLEEVSSLIQGIDIDLNGIKYMKKTGFSNIFHIDASRLAERNDNLLDEYDVVLLADIIEHSENPFSVLKGAASRINNKGILIISVPNAFYWYGFLRNIIRRDVIHPDHVATYAKKNLQELLKRSGLKVISMNGYYEGPQTKKNKNIVVGFFKLIDRAIIFLFPELTSGIICLATKG